MRILLSLFILGFSFGFGPCLASCGPILISYIAGNKKNILKSLWAYALFSSARIFVYCLLGLLIYFLGRFFAEHLLQGLSRYIYIAGGVFVVVIGTLTASGKRLENRPCQFLKKNLLEYDKKSILIFGFVIALLPCAPLLALLSYVGLISKSWVFSLLYSLIFGLGTLVSPLLALVFLASFISRLAMGEQKIYGQIFSFICGMVIIYLGIQLLIRGAA